ncbi:MAG: phenylalanine--tRNA ligase subunit beta [Firmicutes bacterium]|nr:phenylalanine--tRNA ligase subunit beta [Bacillota bacterium]
MLVPVKWIKDYVDVKLTADEYGEMMTTAGLTLETIEYFGQEIENVVVGKIEKIEQHPNAEKLVICQMNVGKEELVQIVTGADNVSEGDFVPVVLDGGRVPGPLHGKEKEEGGTVIHAGELRGVKSDGMLCGPQELGWEDKVAPYISKDGIWLLPGNDWTPGQDLVEALGLDTYVLDVDVTPNRPDCLSILALAKETKAFTGETFTKPSTQIKGPVQRMGQNSIRFQPPKKEKIHSYLQVEVNDPNCKRYVAKVIKDIKIKQSPWWLQERLMYSGMRPINNIVDITNYVMLEYGQPLHAFDINMLAEKKIVVAPSEEGDTFVTLDGKERKMPAGVMMINDGEKAVGIAGIMGGLNSEVTEDTKVIVLESANFDADNIRISSKKLGMSTEASKRFSRGVDANIAREAANRFCHLVEKLGAGTIVDDIIDIYPEKITAITTDVRIDRMNKLNGTDIPKETIIGYLKALDMVVEETEDENVIRVTPPTERLDMKEEIDYAEEIARMYGYDNIPMTLPKMNTKSISTRSWQIREIAKNVMTSLGSNEIQTYSFVSPRSVDPLRLEDDTWEKNFLILLNPLGDETSAMRTMLMPEMLEVMGRNFSRNVDRVNAFEIGNTFLPDIMDEGKLPSEELSMSIGAYGEGEDFFTMKGRVETLLSMLGIKNLHFEAESEYGAFHPGRCARIVIEDRGFPMELGIMGEVHPEVAESFGIGTRAYVCELNFEYVIEKASIEKSYKPLPKFPAMTRDIALIVSEEVKVGDLEKTIIAAGGNLLESVELFDVYRGKQVEEGKKSLAFSIVYRDAQKTLTDDDVQGVHGDILNALKENYNAVLREM